MKYKKKIIKFDKYIIKFLPSYKQLYIFNKINSILKNKLDVDKIHMTLLYLKMNPKLMKKLINIDKLLDYCEKVIKDITIYPTSSNEVIKPITDVFAVMYDSSFEFDKAINKIHNFIIKMITSKLDKLRKKYTVKLKCEQDGGVWLYIDIVQNKNIISILKMRSDPLLPHMSFSHHSQSRNKNPITVHDIRKIYRNNKLRKEISRSQLKLGHGIVDLS